MRKIKRVSTKNFVQDIIDSGWEYDESVGQYYKEFKYCDIHASGLHIQLTKDGLAIWYDENYDEFSVTLSYGAMEVLTLDGDDVKHYSINKKSCLLENTSGGELYFS